MKPTNTAARYERVAPLERNFPVKFRPYRSDRVLPHWHEHIELLYFVSGGGTVMLDGARHPVAPGDLAIVNSRVIHSFLASAPAEYYCILIYPDFFADISIGELRFFPTVHADAEVAACFSALFSEYDSGGLGSDMMQKSIAYRLLAYLARHHACAGQSESERQLHRLMLSRFTSVVQYVGAHYAEPLTTRRLADMCYLSEGHFCRFFKAATGKTPLSYINEYRIDCAATLLCETDKPITEIALSCGFSDVNYFSRVFRSVRGCSPSAFRRAALAKK